MNEKLTKFFGGAFHKWVFLLTLISSILLIGISFFIPPMAVVDGSIIACVGELFGFAALGEVGAAIEKGHGASITHGGTTIEIKKEDDETGLEEEIE